MTTLIENHIIEMSNKLKMEKMFVRSRGTVENPSCRATRGLLICQQNQMIISCRMLSILNTNRYRLQKQVKFLRIPNFLEKVFFKEINTKKLLFD
jgi:hypothetical protein